MGESFEILFWLVVFVIIALRGAAANRARSKASRPPPRDDVAQAPASGRRGIFADLMAQIEAQVEAQREAEARAEGVEPRRSDPTHVDPGAARSRRVETVESRSHPADHRTPAAYPLGGRMRRTGLPAARGPAGAERQRPSAPEPWRPPAPKLEDRDPEHRDLPAEPGDLVPGRRVHAPGTVQVGLPEVASALAPALARRSSPPTIGGAASDDGPGVERVGRRAPAGGGLARFETYAPLRRAIIVSEILASPPGLTGVSPAERRLEEAG